MKNSPGFVFFSQSLKGRPFGQYKEISDLKVLVLDFPVTTSLSVYK